MEPSGGRGRCLLVTILVTTAVLCVHSGKRTLKTTGRKIGRTTGRTTVYNIIVLIENYVPNSTRSMLIQKEIYRLCTQHAALSGHAVPHMTTITTTVVM